MFLTYALVATVGGLFQGLGWIVSFSCGLGDGILGGYSGWLLGVLSKESEIREIRTDQVTAGRAVLGHHPPGLLQNTVSKAVSSVRNHSDMEAVCSCLWPEHEGCWKPLVGEELVHTGGMGELRN